MIIESKRVPILQRNTLGPSNCVDNYDESRIVNRFKQVVQSLLNMVLLGSTLNRANLTTHQPKYTRCLIEINNLIRPEYRKLGPI